MPMTVPSSPSIGATLEDVGEVADAFQMMSLSRRPSVSIMLSMIDWLLPWFSTQRKTIGAMNTPLLRAAGVGGGVVAAHQDQVRHLVDEPRGRGGAAVDRQQKPEEEHQRQDAEPGDDPVDHRREEKHLLELVQRLGRQVAELDEPGAAASDSRGTAGAGVGGGGCGGGGCPRGIGCRGRGGAAAGRGGGGCR